VVVDGVVSGNAASASRAAVRWNVGPPAVTLVVVASRRRLVDIAALVAPWSVAQSRAEVQNSGLSSLLSYQTVRLCVFLWCVLRFEFVI